MSDSWSEFFENFLRGMIPMNITRRQVFSSLLTELTVHSMEMDGIKAFKLSDLGDMHDEQLGEVYPTFLPGTNIWVEEGILWTHPRNEEKPIKLFPLDKPTQIAMDHFNGETKIAEIASNLSEAMDWDFNRSFAYTRGLFLTLVFAGVCVPCRSLG
jgi:hypothetical protein